MYSAFGILRIIVALAFVAVLLNGCKPRTQAPSGTVRVRINEEPATLNGFLLSDANKTTILSYIQWSPLSIDPLTLQWTPVVADSLPRTHVLPNGRLRVTLRLRPEAHWDDGRPVTAKDVLFSLKLLLCPGVNSQHLRNFYINLEGAEADTEDSLVYHVIFREPLFNAPSLAGDLYLFPEHLLDSTYILRRYTVADMLFRGDSIAQDKDVQRLAEWFNTHYNGRQVLHGCGPYRLKQWEADKRLVLERKKPWWGDTLSSRPGISVFFQARPQTIVFEIIRDEQTALSALRSGQLDVLGGISAAVFKKLADSAGTRFQTFSPNLMAYHALHFNMRHPVLTALPVRKALAHLINTEDIVRVVFENMVYPAATFIHPSRKELLNDTLKPYAYNPKLAAEILRNEGWKDTDGDGILDKIIQGRRQSMRFTLYTNSGNAARLRMAEMFREACRPLGIAIDVQTLELRQLIERIRSHHFDMYMGGMISSVVDPDPYQIWHSQAYTTGSNFTGFGTPASDALIERYRRSLDRTERLRLLKELQAIVYEQVPAVFIVAEKDRIAVSSRVQNITISDQRPGYWLGTAEVSERPQAKLGRKNSYFFE
ncbi:MAG: ABC transporter substrate-binding protein [Flavobacteriales bacterium]|nr:ABC transporter substrate-binding protein [Flavobacteriales bacterium]